MRATSQRLKELKGTARNDRARKELTLKTGAKMPSYLSKAARAEWKRIGPELEAAGILTEASANIFASYCVSFALWRECLESIATQGQVVLVTSQTRTGSTTVPKPNPAVRNLGEHQRAMLASAKLFGIDPLSRPRIEAQPVTPAKPTETVHPANCTCATCDPYNLEM
jgi:P27 family predicted phage terminase small subunit